VEGRSKIAEVKEQLLVISCQFLVQVSPQAGFAIFFKFQEHDAVAEVGVAGNDASGEVDLGCVEREGDAEECSDGELIGDHDAAAGEADFRSFEAERSGNAVGLHLDGKPQVEAGVETAFGLGDGGRTAGHWGKIGRWAGEY